MLKILQVNVVSNVLSTGKITNDIAHSSLTYGLNPYIAFGREGKKGFAKEIKIGSKIDVYLHYLGDKLFDNEGLCSKKATRDFLKKVDLLKPDIIHLHNIHDHYLNYPLLFQYIINNHIPVVWTQHDCWSFTGGCGYFDMTDCEEWKRGCKICNCRKHLLRNMSDRNYSLKKDYIDKIEKLVFVPVSNWLADLMKQSEYRNRDIRVIHNGIDIQKFKPVKIKHHSDKFKILGVAAPWSERKGLKDFVKLRGMLSDDYQITLVGLSDVQIKQLPKGIIGIKRTTNIDQLVELYSESDVFVNPTYSDNFPTTNLEALACGTPVITYSTGGSPEAIDQMTGVIVEQGNIVNMCNSIMKIRSEPFSSDTCRKRALMCFDKEKNFNRYIDIYYDLLK